MPTVHTSAASLYRAILSDAADSGDDDYGHAMPEWRQADEGEMADYTDFECHDVRKVESLQERARGKVAMHGCEHPGRRPDVRVTYTSRMPDGVRSSMTVRRTRARLLALADTVRIKWALFGGGPVPADLVKPKAVKRAVTWPASIIKVWLQQFEDKDYAGALLTGERLDAVFYPGAKGCAFILAAPIQVEGLPEGVCSARRNDGKWVVACMQSGRAIESRGYGSRKTAEESAISEVARVGLDKLTAALERNRADAVDHDEARAAWCKACNIEDPREPAQVAQPAPESEEGAESADEWAARMVAMVAQPVDVAPVATAPDALERSPEPAPVPVAPDAAPVAPVAAVAPPVAVCAAPVVETPAHPLAVSAAKLESLRAELADEARTGARSDGFLLHCIELHQAAHDKLAAAFRVFDFVGLGAELANTDGRRFCVLLPDASAPGSYRWQGFDARGFFTHSTHPNAWLAVADAADQGYTVAAPGILDRLASTPEWAHGMAVSEVIQARNSGLLPWREAHDRLATLYAKHAALASRAPEVAPEGPGPAAAPGVAESAPPVTVSAGPDAATMRKAADRAQVLADGIKAAAGDDPATMARMLKSEAARVKAAALGMPSRIAASYRATADMLEHAAELHADALAEVPDMAREARPGMRVQATARRTVMARRSPLAQPWRTGPATARQGRAAPRMRPQAAAPPVWVCAAPVGESGQRFN